MSFQVKKIYAIGESLGTLDEYIFLNGQVFDQINLNFIDLNTAVAANCNVPITESGTSTGMYPEASPMGIEDIPDGVYDIVIHSRSGGNPSLSAATIEYEDPQVQFVDGSRADPVGSATATVDTAAIAAAVWVNSGRTLTEGVTRVVSPFQADALTIVKGASYATANNTDIRLNKSATATWPSDLFTGGYTLTFTLNPTGSLSADVAVPGTLGTTGSIISATQVSLGSMSAALTGNLSVKANNQGANVYTYKIWATKAGAQYLLASGPLSVVPLS